MALVSIFAVLLILGNNLNCEANDNELVVQPRTFDLLTPMLNLIWPILPPPAGFLIQKLTGLLSKVVSPGKKEQPQIHHHFYIPEVPPNYVPPPGQQGDIVKQIQALLDQAQKVNPNAGITPPTNEILKQATEAVEKLQVIQEKNPAAVKDVTVSKVIGDVFKVLKTVGGWLLPKKQTISVQSQTANNLPKSVQQHLAVLKAALKKKP